ncbi:hypothetical protein QFZ66_001211 [Streptomyces sp. B4I13]|nr:hypothetical protein [Streptomyces sp. B4I13]
MTRLSSAPAAVSHEASAEPAKSVVSPRQTARSAANDA